MKYESISHTVSAISVEDIIAGKHNYPWFLELLSAQIVFIGIGAIVVHINDDYYTIKSGDYLVLKDDELLSMHSDEFAKTYRAVIKTEKDNRLFPYGYAIGGFI